MTMSLNTPTHPHPVFPSSVAELEQLTNDIPVHIIVLPGYRKPRVHRDTWVQAQR